MLMDMDWTFCDTRHNFESVVFYRDSICVSTRIRIFVQRRYLSMVRQKKVMCREGMLRVTALSQTVFFLPQSNCFQCLYQSASESSSKHTEHTKRSSKLKLIWWKILCQTRGKTWGVLDCQVCCSTDILQFLQTSG